MKKTYKAPKYKTIDLSGEAMIAGSQTGGDPNSAFNLCSEEEDMVKGASHMNLWDDEW